MSKLSVENYLSFFIEKTKSGKGDSDRHLLTLFSIAVSSNAKNIVELGVRNGDTTLPLALAAFLNKGKVHSVDIVNTDYSLPAPLKAHSQFYNTDSISFLNTWNKSDSIDLIYIDDWHSYEHVKEELRILDELVTPKSLLILHDLMYGETCPYYHLDLTLDKGQWANGGPYRAVAELSTQFWEFSTLPWNNGLTILRKKYTSKFKR